MTTGQNISKGLPENSTRDHFRVLPHGQVAGALQAVRGSRAWLGTKLALEFLVLTAARSSEVRLALWDEIDLDAALWTIPASRMKTEREHRVPLSAPALSVMEQARELSAGEGLVFPSSTGKVLRSYALSKLLKDRGIEAVPHGFRSSFRAWCAESNIDRRVAEVALAQPPVGVVETALRRSDYLEQRREVMVAWAEHVTAEPDRAGAAFGVELE